MTYETDRYQQIDLEQSVATTSAPYNFVPLSKKVFFPKWSRAVSHDRPFADGISGTIDCEIECTSPIYIRNGGDWRDKDKNSDAAAAFFKVGHDTIIPGTSLKGMLRSVIEIASFGKMERINDHRFSVRDLSEPNGFYLKSMKRNPVSAGWLQYDPINNSWSLASCTYVKVSHRDLEEYFTKITGKTARLKQQKTSVDKYKTWGTAPLTTSFDILSDKKGNKANQLGNGSLHGQLVFSGQAGKKASEFVFTAGEGEPQAIDAKIIADFEFIHSERGEPNTEWKHWKGRAVKLGNKVPVFFIGPDENPISIGLCSMFRLAYKYSIGESIGLINNGIHQDIIPDFAETLFGHSEEKMGNALKGRISISHALADPATVRSAPEVNTVLGQPKPTYVPNYLEQANPKSGYTTYMDKGCKVRGWKRYPARTESAAFPQNPTENMATRFTPLQTGARFRFRIRVHNLRPAEYAALQWALTWGGDANLRHSLGMGKAYGQGQAAINITGSNLITPTGTPAENPGITPFVALMTEEISGWEESEQLFQLKAMADPEILPKEVQQKKLRHMTLDNGNEFITAKKQIKSLAPHVPFTGLPDAERFKDFDYQSAAQKQAAALEVERLQQVAKDSRLRQVKAINQWGVLKDTILTNETALTYRDETGYAKGVKDAAETIRQNQPDKWDSDRDQLVADWLKVVGMEWAQKVVPSKQTQATDPMLESVASLSDWGAFQQSGLQIADLSEVSLHALSEKFKAWGCNNKNAKKDKLGAWKQLQKSLKK